MMLTHLSFGSKMIKNDSKNYLSQRNNIPLHIRGKLMSLGVYKFMGGLGS